MQELVAPLERLDHHPRLENQWRTVIVSFTTWDIDHKITSLDIESAQAVDAVFNRFST
jgi:pterin-4a-carbinolamine dehydratase